MATDRDPLQDYLEGLSPVSRAYRQLKDQPLDESIDRTLLAQARQALDSAPRTPERSLVPRWTAPFAVAATVMLSLGILFAAVLSPRPSARSDDAWRVMPTALRGERPMLRHAPAPARVRREQDIEPVAPLVPHRQLYTSDPPHSRPTQIDSRSSALDTRDPLRWRARIAELRASGRDREAAELQREFERLFAHPAESSP